MSSKFTLEEVIGKTVRCKDGSAYKIIDAKGDGFMHEIEKNFFGFGYLENIIEIIDPPQKNYLLHLEYYISFLDCFASNVYSPPDCSSIEDAERIIKALVNIDDGKLNRAEIYEISNRVVLDVNVLQKK